LSEENLWGVEEQREKQLSTSMHFMRSKAIKARSGKTHHPKESVSAKEQETT
jgi:hypothetical protein